MDQLRPAPPTTVVAARWRALGVEPLVVNGTRVNDFASAAEALATGARFPEWAGRNLDALFDALCDLSWIDAEQVAVIWTHADRLWHLDENDRTALLSVLTDAAGGSERGSKVASVVLCFRA